jgi:hypothetical protein
LVSTISSVLQFLSIHSISGSKGFRTSFLCKIPELPQVDWGVGGDGGKVPTHSGCRTVLLCKIPWSCHTFRRSRRPGVAGKRGGIHQTSCDIQFLMCTWFLRSVNHGATKTFSTNQHHLGSHVQQNRRRKGTVGSSYGGF